MSTDNLLECGNTKNHDYKRCTKVTQLNVANIHNPLQNNGRVVGNIPIWFIYVINHYEDYIAFHNSKENVQK